MRTFYMALCADCEMDVPFLNEDQRDEWALAHMGVIDPFSGAYHRVTRHEEVR